MAIGPVIRNRNLLDQSRADRANALRHDPIQNENATTSRRISDDRLRAGKEFLLTSKGHGPAPGEPGYVMTQIGGNRCYIMQARMWAREMIQAECRGPGDKDNAMRRLAHRHRLPYGLLWRLTYKPPKGIFWDVYERLRSAYSDEKARQAASLASEIAVLRLQVSDFERDRLDEMLTRLDAAFQGNEDAVE